MDSFGACYFTSGSEGANPTRVNIKLTDVPTLVGWIILANIALSPLALGQTTTRHLSAARCAETP
jgi:hypothetical protein